MSFTVRTLKSQKKQRFTVWASRLAAALTLARPVYHWYHEWHQNRVAAKQRTKRIGLLKRVLSILIAVLFAVFVLGGVAKAIMTVSGIGLDNVLSVAAVELPEDEHGHINLLLLGQGHKDHDGKDLTDTIMVASFDKESGTTVLLSLPRDLYLLETERMGAGKINTFYRDFKNYLEYQEGMTPEEAAKAALQELAAEIGRKLDIDIHHAVKVDFVAFVRAVDVLGGVTVDVPYDIEDLEYPDENYGYDPFVIEAGPRHLDGETALKYARSRHTSSDFGRSARQQQLLAAMAEKAKEEGILTDPSAITSFMKIMSENVLTTMSLRELISLASMGKNLNRDQIVSLQINDRNALYDIYIEPGGFLYTPPRDLFDGAAVLLPVSIPEFPVTFKQLQTLGSLLFHQRNLYLNKPTIAVLNAGAPSGAARRLANELTRYGFPVQEIANADSAQQDVSQIITPATPHPVIDYFSEVLNIEQRPAPADLPPEQIVEFTIIIGRDYNYTPFQDLIAPPPNPDPSPNPNNNDAS